MARGAHYLIPFNDLLKFKAAKDLIEYGTVEYLDFDKIIEN